MEGEGEVREVRVQFFRPDQKRSCSLDVATHSPPFAWREK